MGKWMKNGSNNLQISTLNKLSNTFQKCHDSIWEGGKRDPASAFDEFSKILMVKIYDERFTPTDKKYQIQVFVNDTKTMVANRVKTIYENVKRRNKDVFNKDIELPDKIIFEVVKCLQGISLRGTDIDIKGRAFEKFLGKVFRDEYGQYFTPRDVVRFMVSVLNPTEDDIIIDPACGSGGFLLYSMISVLETISTKYKNDQDSIARIGWEFAHKQIFGIEINDRIARIAMMDMIIHEDGHSNIECCNALSDFSSFDRIREIGPDKFSIILTNPPFGSVVSDKNILTNFKLTNKKERQKTEILFIERCIDLLCEGGRLGIVLPDSILNNLTLQYVRDFIMKNSRILAIVSLPQHAFVPSGAGVKSSLVFVEKRKNLLSNYEVFMGIANHIGFDSRGEKDTNDLKGILEEWNNFQVKNQTSNHSFSIQVKDIEDNFSPEKHLSNLQRNNLNERTLGELCNGRIFSGKTPARKEYTDLGHKILKVRDLTGRGINWENNTRGFVSDLYYQKKMTYKLQESRLRRQLLSFKGLIQTTLPP